MGINILVNRNLDTKEKRKIELCYFINNDVKGSGVDDRITDSFTHNASEYDEVCLVSKGDSFDVIACWDLGDDSSNVGGYLGHWNDGIM